MKLLLAGDLHIGRSSTRVASTANADDLRTVGAWRRIVDLAIEQRVDVVCLSGDVTDQANRFWEAIGPLESGVRDLAKRGVLTLAVSGNHDHDVLARLADQLPPEAFRLLGRGGRWERVTLEEDGRPALHVDGWSFPERSVRTSPLETYRFTPDPATPTLGMVHGDLDAPQSIYAPVSLAGLRAAGPQAWLLGHIHAPALYEGAPWVLYAGSPQAMDPGETGLHGPWRVDVAHGVITTPTMVPQSTVWYGRHAIDLAGVSDRLALERVVIDGLRTLAETLDDQAGGRLLHARVRLELLGETPLSREVEAEARRITEHFEMPVGDQGVLSVERIDVQTSPELDLQAHAGSDTAIGALARLLIELDGSDQAGLEASAPAPARAADDAAKLIADTRREMEELARTTAYAALDSPEVTPDMAKDVLRKQARRLLAELVSQIHAEAPES